MDRYNKYLQAVQTHASTHAHVHTIKSGMVGAGLQGVTTQKDQSQIARDQVLYLQLQLQLHYRMFMTLVQLLSFNLVIVMY